MRVVFTNNGTFVPAMNCSDVFREEIAEDETGFFDIALPSAV